jgi:hypothetical protein
MAIYTAAAGGGNWNVAATWGGAGVPTTGDTAILNGTSGPVTVTANALCLVLNCTGYANTLTINTGFSINVSGTGATISLGGTINPTTTGVLSTVSTTTAIIITFNGVTVPRLSLGFSSGAGTQTVTINGTTPTVENLTVNNGVSGGVVLANTPLNISASLVVGFGAGGTGNGAISGVAFNFIGTACSVNCTAGLGSGRINSGFTVASGCTLTLLSTLQIGGGTVTFSSGSFLAYSGSFGLYLNAISTAVTLDTSNVTWHNINFASSTTVSISSDINVLTSFTNTAAASSPFIGTAGAAKNINIGGSFTINNPFIFNMSNTIINLIGTGVLDGAVNSFISGGLSGTTININGTGPYTIGTATRNYLGTEVSVTINLVGTSVATVNAGHTLATRTGTPLTLSTNNTGTGANILGGSEIIWQNFTFGSNTILSLTYETKFAGNLTGPSAGSGSINGQKFLLGGNITTGVTGPVIGGTSTIELYGSNTVNWNTAGFNSTYQNNIVINKSGGTVNLLGTINWGLSGRTLSRTTGNINAGTSTVIIPNALVTINNMVFNNLTITAGTPIITQNQLNTINSSLVLLGTATFAGTAGWTAFSFTHGGAGTTCTLKAGVTYTVQNGVFTMIGTAASRAILQSDDVVAVTASIPANSNQMTLTATVPNPVGYVLGSTAFSTTLPAALSNILPDRPTIVSGPVGLVYTLANSIGPTQLTSYAGQLGKKAFFSVFGTTNVVYAATRDIDSSGGITIYAGQSFPDSTATPNQFRTLNWQPLIAPSGSVYYTWVD